MSQKLVSRNDDIRRLVEKGYAVGFDSNYLIIRDIPYLDDKGALKWGAFVTKLVFTDQEDQVVQEDHQVFFAGSHPHGVDGAAIPNLGGGPTTLALSEAAADVVVERQFSNKPRVNGQMVGFPDFFAKIESYAGIIVGPAEAKHGAEPLTFRTVEPAPEDSVFKIRDTLTSRAEITDLSAKFKNEVIAIIGLGGTGGYVLDFMVKTAVREIRGFDRDPYHIHNAFRSPGRFHPDDFKEPKADVHQARYENFRHGLSLKAKYIDASCTDELAGVSFAFICVDKGPSRAGIFDLLMAMKIPFIDVGMGLNRKRGALNGMARVTYYSVEDAERLRGKALAELTERPDDVYRTNIQTAELNALNAALAAIKYKQIKDFYLQDEPAYHFLFEVTDFKIAVASDET